MNTPDRIVLEQVGKAYSMERSAVKRLARVLANRQDRGPVFMALTDINLRIASGETVGIIGPNGAGKSTLLQIISGVLGPTVGHCHVLGRVTALLELGAGFSTEMTGRENVLLNGPLLGLSVRETEQLLPQIVQFADIGEHIDQPVKTYSSGMFVRLAFSLITAARPDILIIDEALSVGDAAFATKSFDRILALKRSGTTILFCSHALYQVQALCDRAIWLLQGRVMADGKPRDVINAYQTFLNAPHLTHRAPDRAAVSFASSANAPALEAPISRLTQVVVVPPPDGVWYCGKTDLQIEVEFQSQASQAGPHVAVLIYGADDRLIASVGTHNDGCAPKRDPKGFGRVGLRFTQLPLLAGSYRVDVVLLCDRGVLFLDTAAGAARIDVVQQGLEMGIVSLARQWQGTEPL
jgi:lipopolysaccharide transport system ATP-binding protein